jgi:hypothetical protein
LFANIPVAPEEGAVTPIVSPFFIGFGYSTIVYLLPPFNYLLIYLCYHLNIQLKFQLLSFDFHQV